MNAVNSARLFALVWTFTAVCQADGVISVICEDVTGTVGEEVTFTCSVTVKRSECCIKLYKFLNPESENSICTKELPKDSCEQRNSFTCRYTPTTAMTERFRFFVQTPCGYNKPTEFTVNITEATKPKTEAPPIRNVQIGSNTTKSPGSNDSVVASVVGCVTIIIIIIIILTMTIIYKMKSSSSTPRSGCVWAADMMTTATSKSKSHKMINITDSTV